jgi:hypothetical protein
MSTPRKVTIGGSEFTLEDLPTETIARRRDPISWTAVIEPMPGQPLPKVDTLTRIKVSSDGQRLDRCGVEVAVRIASCDPNLNGPVGTWLLRLEEIL